jgi:outer membrane translocation and assembly module TamA
VFSAESRWGLFEHVDAALFVDTGRVADRIADLGASGLHSSVGAGVRFHTTRATLARLDVAHSTEGWHVVFRLTEPFKRKTFSDNLAPAVPFVP